MTSRFRLLLPSVVLVLLAAQGLPIAVAQSTIAPNGLSAPSYGGTPGAPRFTQDARPATILGAQAPPHLNPSGKPCVAVNPIATPQMINKNVYDHDVLISNQCSRNIRLSVCYYQTRNCSMMSIAGYARQRKLLGVFPEKDFRIEYREYLD